MLFQPTNLVPSSFAGFGGDVIDVTVENEFLLQLNGNSALLAYQLTIMNNDSLSAVKYNTPKVVLDTPIYPINHKGEQQYLTVTIPVNTTSTLENGKEYKWKIQLWWGSTNIDSIISTESYFKTSSTPTVVIDNDLATLSTKNITLTATYSQTENVPIQWFKWVLAKKDGSDRSEVVVDTGEIYSINIKLEYDALEDGNDYSAQVTVKNNDGVEATSDWYDFAVTYSKPTVQGYLNAVLTPSTGIKLEWSKLKFIQGATSAGSEVYLADKPVDNHISIDIQPEQSIIFDGTSENGFELDTNVTHVWSGKLPEGFDGLFYKASGTDLAGNPYKLEIFYDNTSKQFKLHVNDVFISHISAPVILNRWFNIQATNSSFSANLSMSDVWEGSFVVESLYNNADFYIAGEVSDVSYIDTGNLTNIESVNNSFALQTIYSNTKTHTVKLINNYFQKLSFGDSNVGKNKIKDLDLKGLTSLTTIESGKNLYGTIDITGLVNLTKLDLSNTPKIKLDGITSIATGSTIYPSLTNINISENSIGWMDFSRFPNLEKLEMSNTNCLTLDLSANSNLAELDLHKHDSINRNPILNTQANMVSMANTLPSRVGMDKGIIKTYPSNRDWIKTICDGKNWETYRVATITTKIYRANGTISIPLDINDVAYIDWGDGSQEMLTDLKQLVTLAHTYSSAGNYTIKMYLNNFTKIGSEGSSPHFSYDYEYGYTGTVTAIDITEFTNLTHIAFRYNAFSGGSLSSLNITGLTNLTSISLDGARVPSLITGGTIFSKVTWLDLDSCPLGNFSLSMFPGITSSLLIAQTGRTMLDVSPCPGVTYIRLGAYDTSQAGTNGIIRDQTNMVNFANTLPDRKGKSSGKIEIWENTAWGWIASICAAKNWIKA